MSYILDAIKKSEAERGQGSIPGLQTVHSSSLSYKTESKPTWPYILIALLLINSAGLIYFFTQTDNNTHQTNTAKKTSYTTPVKQQITRTQAIVRPNPISREVVDLYPETETQLQVTTKQNSVMSTTFAVSNKIFNVEELPSHIKQRIPTLEFSGHMYSSSPLFRSVIINGSFKEEGSAINNEFTLTEITVNGAIFDYQGTLFEVNVLTGWRVN